MNIGKTKKRLAEIQAQQELDNRLGELNRARSVTVGTAFGGTTEISMRANNGTNIWCLMQPVEVIELIHQLSANVGCHIHLQARDDFSSWREWRVSEAEKKHLNGHAPFVNDMAVFQQLGAANFDQAAAEQTLANNLAQKEYKYVNGGAVKSENTRGTNDDSTMAIKKTINKRGVKQATKTS
jgi:hypothetical protein